ncbi:MAG: type II toxin-antitoxin system HicA family toxin [Candidatus Scalindua sp.]
MHRFFPCNIYNILRDYFNVFICRVNIWIKPGFPPIPVPRHSSDIPIGTLRSIIKNAKLEDKL